MAVLITHNNLMSVAHELTKQAHSNANAACKSFNYRNELGKTVSQLRLLIKASTDIAHSLVKNKTDICVNGTQLLAMGGDKLDTENDSLKHFCEFTSCMWKITKVTSTGCILKCTMKSAMDAGYNNSVSNTDNVITAKVNTVALVELHRIHTKFFN